MAKFSATDYKITINGTNLSTSLNSVELALESDDLETTAFGTTFRERIGGLKSGSVTLQFMQDFAASSVDATLFHERQDPCHFSPQSSETQRPFDATG